MANLMYFARDPITICLEIAEKALIRLRGEATTPVGK